MNWIYESVWQAKLAAEGVINTYGPVSHWVAALGLFDTVTWWGSHWPNTPLLYVPWNNLWALITCLWAEWGLLYAGTQKPGLSTGITLFSCCQAKENTKACPLESLTYTTRGITQILKLPPLIPIPSICIPKCGKKQSTITVFGPT